jgi:hypothetical protein
MKINFAKTRMKKGLINDIEPLIENMKNLSGKAYHIYLPLVENIIENKCVNENEIENLLDYMLGFCADRKMLILYKKLCRYYWNINPLATAEYINYYREMWDNGKQWISS